MPVLLVLFGASLVLPPVFARHGARLVESYVGTLITSKADLAALFKDPLKAREVQLAYRWGMAPGLLKLARWPLLLAVVVVALV